MTGQSVQVSLKVNPHTVDDNTKRKGKSDENINVNVNDQSDHNTRCLRQTVLSPCQIQKSILSSCKRTTQNVKEKYDQYPVSCSGGQRPVDGLSQQPRSHQLTACVGQSRGFFRHLDIMTMDEAKTKWTSSFKQN